MYTVKNVKTFRGREGHGFNATLCRDGKQIALVMDDASGGEADFEWNDRTAERVDIHITDHMDHAFTYQGTPEEKLFVELANSQSYTFDGHTSRKNAAILVEDLIETARVRRDCKNKTVYRLTSDGEGVERVAKVKYTPEYAAQIRARYGADLIEIVNERAEIRQD